MSALPLTSVSAQQKVEKDITAVMETMAEATVKKDLATLEKVFHDNLIYGHGSGSAQTRTERVKSIAGPGFTQYIKFSDTIIQVYGDVALFRGTVDKREGGSEGLHSPRHINVLWVLVKGPQGWQIVARQVTEGRS